MSAFTPPTATLCMLDSSPLTRLLCICDHITCPKIIFYLSWHTIIFTKGNYLFLVQRNKCLQLQLLQLLHLQLQLLLQLLLLSLLIGIGKVSLLFSPYLFDGNQIRIHDFWGCTNTKTMLSHERGWGFGQKTTMTILQC